jgi:hypothetical protein
MTMAPMHACAAVALLAVSHGVARASACAAPHGQSPSPAATAWPQVVRDGDRAFTLFAPCFVSYDGANVLIEQAIVRGDGALRAAGAGRVTSMANAVPGAGAGELEVNGFAVQSLAFDGAAAPADERAALQRAIGGRAFATTRRAVTHDMVLTNLREASTDGLGDDVPAFRVARRRTALVTIDGEPRVAPVGGTSWNRIGNTPFVVLQAPDGSFRVRLGASTWMSGDSLAGDYAPCDPPPPEVLAGLGPQPIAKEAGGGAPGTPAAPGAGGPPGAAAAPRAAPAVAVVTEPTVLVWFDGDPQRVPVATGVEWVANAHPVLLRAGDAWWTLASGRWFRATSLDGAWARVAPADVPASFGMLPSGRTFAAAKASVPHTPEAVNAVASTLERRAITVSRTDAYCSTRWNGAPAWQPVGTTPMRISVNASQPVIESGGRWYCCDNAVWFTSGTPTGPWDLCDSLPDAIDSAPAGSVAFPLTFVDVLASDARSVTFAWTPGYFGTYVDAGTVVFGTGWPAPPVPYAVGGGTVWAPQPQTFGMDAAFDADTGTFASGSFGLDADEAPAVQSQVLVGGWVGWGWCPGWTSAFAWGSVDPAWRASWDERWRSWNPYWNRWANARTAEQRSRDEADARELAARDRAADAAAERAAEEARAQAAADESAWRERQRALGEAAVQAERAQDMARAARLADARAEQARVQADLDRWNQLARGGPVAPRGSMAWWYQFYNDQSHGYLGRATGYRDPRYPGGAWGARAAPGIPAPGAGVR